MKMAACFVLSALVLTGCSHSSTSTYDAADVGRTIDNTKASVIASRLVDISGETNAVGPVAGGVAGAAGTGLAVHRVPLTSSMTRAVNSHRPSPGS